MQASPVETVKSLFQFFGAGDLPAVLGLLAEDVVWSGGKFDTDIQAHVERRGRLEVPKFFESVAREQEFHRFEPTRFFCDGSDVAALVHEDFTFRRSGERIALDVFHHFTANAEGLIARYRSYYDTSRYVTAYRG
jgi:ketosteroid isomerase-like protein